MSADLSADELDLLRGYDPERGRIWDAASLMPTVFKLIANGLIERVRYDAITDAYFPDPAGLTRACRLTDKGRRVLETADG